MIDAHVLPPKVQKLLDRFARERAKADSCLDALDATATELARGLLAAGLSMREAAPRMSREDLPITHAQVAHARDGGHSRKPWAGHRRQGRTLG